MLDRSISRRYRWKVQGRMAVLEYAAAHGIRPAAARFGLDRKTVRAWRSRLREAGTVVADVASGVEYVNGVRAVNRGEKKAAA